MDIYKDTDLQDSIKALFAQIDPKLDTNVDPNELYSMYYNYIFRLILPSKRTVHKAPAFQSSYNNLSNLEKNQIEDLIQKIENGDVLTAHLSNHVLKYKEEKLDKLLMDWGIYHLHLVPSPQRTGRLIFAVFNEANAYLLDIKDHTSFQDTDLCRILQNTYPKLIKKYELSDNYSSMVENPDKDTVKAARDLNINLYFGIDSSIVTGWGGGITSTGTSGMAQDNISCLFRFLGENTNSYKLDIESCIIIENMNNPSDRRYIYCRHPSINVFKE